jgi:CheY-like chemotaxis protein
MRRIKDILDESPGGKDRSIRTVWYNAWTAERDNVLEGLIKSVLTQIDPNILRRALRNQQLTGYVRLTVGAVAGVFGLSNAVDAVWTKISVDAKTRNQAAGLFRDAMQRWLDKNHGTSGRVVVVFIDDLDRCSPRNVVRVFEALKLYLDAKGFVFVVGYDQRALATAVAHDKNYGDGDLSLQYLEKIVQVGYAIGEPSPDQIKAFMDSACVTSNTSALLDQSARTLITDRNARNPRRIKRFINRFVLESMLSTDQAVDADVLITLLILQVYFPDFFRTVASGTRQDPIGEFLDYVDAIDFSRTGEGDEAKFHAFLQAEQTRLPAGHSPEEHQAALVTAAERLPVEFPDLARNAEFVSLLRTPAIQNSREALYARAQHLLIQADQRTTDQAFGESAPTSGSSAADGGGPIRVLWIDDSPDGNAAIARRLESTGVRVTTALDVEAASRALKASVPPDVVISDVTRGGQEVGFDDAMRLQKEGFNGKFIFYASRVTPERIARARALDAPMTNDPTVIFDTIDRMRLPTSAAS